MHTTPSRRGLSDAGPTVSNMKMELTRDVSERFVDNKLDVKEFVHQVWGVDQPVIDTILGAAEKFESKLLSDLIDKYKNAAGKREPMTYGPFSNLSEYLSGRLQTIFPKHEFINRLYSERGEMVINSGYNKRKPDTIVVPKGYKGKFDWKHILVPFEFKTRDKHTGRQKPRLPTAISSNLSKTLFPSDDGQPSQSFDDGLPFARVDSRHDKSMHPSATSSDVLPNSSYTPPAEENVVDKDGSSITAYASNQSTPHVSKAQVDKFEALKRDSVVPNTPSGKAIGAMSTSKKVNINRETKSHPPKSIDAGPSSTESVNKRLADDFPSQPSSKRRKNDLHATVEQLQLARYALECMAAASRHYVAGVFIHRFNISLWYYDRAIVARTVDFNFETQPEMLALVLYALFTCDSRHAGFDPFIIPASHPCPSHINQLFEASTSIGQSEGDQIVLISKDGSVKRYKITGKRLFANRCLVGRGTVVFPVSTTDESDVTDEQQVVKISWPDEKRVKEAAVIGKLRKAISEMARHLPDVASFLDMTADQLHLPRHLLNITVTEDLDRRLHVMAMKRYKALWDVDSVEEFQEVFVDCVECALTVALKF